MFSSKVQSRSGFRVLRLGEVLKVSGGHLDGNPMGDRDPFAEDWWRLVVGGEGPAGSTGGGEIVVEADRLGGPTTGGGASGGGNGSSPADEGSAIEQMNNPASDLSYFLSWFNHSGNFILVTPPMPGPPSGSQGTPMKSEPNECQTDAVHVTVGSTIVSGHMGAEYYAPSSVDNDYLNKAFNFALSMDAKYGNDFSKAFAILELFTNQNHPHFIDFKDIDADTISYESEVDGQIVEDVSPFEAFGNFFYGVYLTAAGYTPEETKAIAGLVQGMPDDLSEFGKVKYIAERIGPVLADAGGNQGDDPRDSVHVTLGINAALAFLASNAVGLDPAHFVDIKSNGCG